MPAIVKPPATRKEEKQRDDQQALKPWRVGAGEAGTLLRGPDTDPALLGHYSLLRYGSATNLPPAAAGWEPQLAAMLQQLHRAR